MASASHKHEPQWIDSAPMGDEYLDPVYYDRILKPYVFSGSSDLDLFRAFLAKCRIKRGAAVLEIGPGTGRATKVLCQITQSLQIDFVDQSRRMLSYLESQVPLEMRARYFKSDAVSYLARTSDMYDFVFSLWSLSHSIHQNLSRNGEQHGKALAAYALRRLFGSVLRPTGRFFFIHFDSASEEQRISLRQRTRIESWIAHGMPSPSQLILEEVLSESATAGLIRFHKRHFVGSPIVYSNLEEALEVFMNFHMEGVFNRAAEFPKVLAELAEDLNQHRLSDGRIAIRPGCFVYSGERL